MLTLSVSLLGFIAPFISSVVGWVDWLFLTYIIEVSEFFGGSAIAKRELEVSAIMVWIYYVLLIALLYRKRLNMAFSRLKH